jgi:hypothetical protein
MNGQNLVKDTQRTGLNTFNFNALHDKTLTSGEEKPKSLPLSSLVHYCYRLTLSQIEELRHLILAFALQSRICFHQLNALSLAWMKFTKHSVSLHNNLFWSLAFMYSSITAYILCLILIFYVSYSL